MRSAPMKRSIYSITLICGLLALVGCRDSDRDLDVSNEASLSVALAESHLFDISQTAIEVGRNCKGFSTGANDITTVYGCDTIASDTVNLTASVYFISACSDAHLRRGSIDITYSNQFDQVNAQATVTLNNYFLNGKQVSGTITITHQGLDALGYTLYRVNTNDLMLYDTLAKNFVKYNSNRAYQQITGVGTTSISDDSYIIQGLSSGTALNGNTFNAETEDSFTMRGDCFYPYSGMIKVTPSNLRIRRIKFNDGCDKTGTVILNGTHHSVSLLR